MADEYTDLDGLVFDDEPVDAGKDLLTSPTYDAWLDAIINDDTKAAEEMYSRAPAEQQTVMLNGLMPDFPFTSKETAKIKNSFHSHMTLMKPWSAAVVYRSQNMIRFMMSRGVDVLQRDHHGNTAIHSLIKAAALDIEQEKQYLDIYGLLMELLSPEDLRMCLLLEDVNAMRPLELAAHLGTFHLMDGIFNTEGVYLTYKEHYGIHTLQFYDITDYETLNPDRPNRADLSPIRLMVYLDKARLTCESSRDFYSREPYVTWFKAKMSINWPAVAMWFASRLVFLFLFFWSNLETVAPSSILSNATLAEALEINITIDGVNETEVPTMCNEQVPAASFQNQLMVYTLTIMSIGILIFDFVDVIHHFRSTPGWLKDRHRNMVLHYPFYRVVQWLLAVCVLTLTVCHIASYQFGIQISVVAEHTVYVLGSSGIIWSILYFIQLVPWLGHYVIAVQRMIQAFAQFAMLFFLFLVSYIFAFRRVLMDTEGQCPEEFATTSNAFYNTFLIMLDMVNLHNFSVIDTWGLYVLHMLYVFLVAVLLVNFLIAIMSDEYSHVADNQYVISRVQTLSVMITVESRVSCVFRGCYERMQQRVFECRGDNIYITRLVMKEKSADG